MEVTGLVYEFASFKSSDLKFAIWHLHEFLLKNFSAGGRAWRVQKA
jgi:hypothetical protein